MIGPGEDDPVLTPKEAAAYARVHVQTLMNAALQREVASIQRVRRGRRFFRKSAIDAWLKRHETRPRRDFRT